MEAKYDFNDLGVAVSETKAYVRNQFCELQISSLLYRQSISLFRYGKVDSRKSFFYQINNE